MTLENLQGQEPAARLLSGQGAAAIERVLGRATLFARIAFESVRKWRERRRARGCWVESLNDRTLEDIGLTRADVRYEPRGTWWEF